MTAKIVTILNADLRPRMVDSLPIPVNHLVKAISAATPTALIAGQDAAAGAAAAVRKEQVLPKVVIIIEVKSETTDVI